MKCLNCGIKFTSKRTTAQFHNATCRQAYNRKKTLESLPGYIKPQTSQEEVNKKVEEAKKKATERVAEESRDIEYAEGGITFKGKFIPDEGLNYAYRGERGKLNLTMDLVYTTFFSVPEIILLEKDRLESVKKRKDSPPDNKYHLKVAKPKEQFTSTQMTFGGVTRNHRLHFMTPNGPVSFPLQT